MTFHLILVLANKRAIINEVTQIWEFFNPPTPSVRHSSLRPCCLKICYPLPLFVLKSFFWGIKPSTNIWVKTKKTRFFPKFHSKIVTFLHFFWFFAQKTRKMSILTSVWGAQNPETGPNIPNWILIFSFVKSWSRFSTCLVLSKFKFSLQILLCFLSYGWLKNS